MLCIIIINIYVYNYIIYKVCMQRLIMRGLCNIMLFGVVATHLILIR